jgi:hypothetical protein
MAKKLRSLRRVARKSGLARGLFKKVNIKLRKPKRLPNRGQAVGPRRVRGPGKWQNARESMSPRAARYQKQITGAPPGKVYKVGDVKFDGYKNGTLLDAKGPGYEWAVKNGQFIRKYKGAESLLDQAQRQVRAANGTPIRWEVAEAKTVEAIRNMFRKNGITGIDVVHTPAVP